jgi:DNA primase catalytic core
MARIPDSELARLKQEVSVQRLAEARGVELRPHGSDLLGLCPFHDDHEPSLVISPQKNLWHCLGACQAGGSVIDWVMKAEGVSFRHAVELLREDLPPSKACSPVKRTTVPKMPLPFERDVEDEELLRQVVGYYHETLKQSSEALAYLESRGLKHPEAIDRFKLGYANRTLGYRLPAKNRKAGAKIRGRLQRLGIYRKSGHEHFNGSLVIPVFGVGQRVVEIYGRKISPRLREGTPLHLYLPGPHRGVWNEEALSAADELILCESLIDALTFWCAGFRNVTTSYGIEGFTLAHLEAFKRSRVRRVLIAYDRDGAGDRVAQALGDKLMAEGIECFRIQFPRGMDANDYALKVQPATRSLEVVIRKAVWMGKGKAPERSAVPPPLEAEPTVVIAADDKEDKVPVEAPAADEPVSPLAAEEEAPSSPLPPAPPRPVVAETRGEDVWINLGDRRWRIRGLSKNLSREQLRVNVLVSHVEEPGAAAGSGAGFHVDTLDLYSARHRTGYIKQAAEELGLKEQVIKKDLGKVLLELEAMQEKQIDAALEPKDERKPMSTSERAAAMALLEDEHLFDRILSDFERCGVVGEETNKLVGYLAAVSRKLEEPLAIVIQSSSAAGKTSLMEAILAFFPPEERVKYSAMTGQSLFYMGEQDLSHKILAIVEEEGAERASYALKLLQSEGELTIASTGKDPTSGRLVTHEYRVEGPVMIFLTTTAVEIDEELLNRCIVLSVDEERQQTRAIHCLQRKQQTLEGLLSHRDREQILELHQNAHRLLKPLLVANPFAEKLTFLDSRTRTRRDHAKYLTLIRAIALLHQHQRTKKSVKHRGQTVSYIEVALEDIALANRLSHQVLGRSLDELSPQTRRLLELVDQMVTEACQRLDMDRCDYRFSRRDVRQYTGWGLTQTRVHLGRLVELEYLIVHRGGRGKSFVYELVHDGEGNSGVSHLDGLTEVEALRGDGTTQTWRGQKGELAGGWRGDGGPKTGGWRGEPSQHSARHLEGLTAPEAKPDGNAHLEPEKTARSYILHRRSDTEAAGDLC